MKVFRMFGMFLMATFLCVNLTSCFGDDDEEEDDGGNGGNGGNGGGIVATGLEGTWIMTNVQGWEMDEGEKDEWNYSYDPQNPVPGTVKMVITNISGNLYGLKYYFYDNGRWEHDAEGDGRMKVEGNMIINPDAPNDPEGRGTFTLNGNQLVIVHAEEDYYEKMTFVRM